VGLIIVGVLIVGVIIWQSNDYPDNDQMEDNNQMETEEPVGDGFSVHDLNWDYYEEMNKHIVDASFTNPPYVVDDDVHGVGYLTVVLRFFRENLNEVSDNQIGRRISLKLHFSGITGDENFLSELSPSVWQENNDGFILNFYFDRTLERECVDSLKEAGWERFAAENPEQIDQRITLAEFDWDALREDYETYIIGFVFEGLQLEGENFNEFVEFYVSTSGSDTILAVIEFLEQNQEEISAINRQESGHGGTMFFRRNSDQDPEVSSTFGMTEELIRTLMDTVGLDVWERSLIE